MSDPRDDELERLLRFLYLVPVGLIRSASDGSIANINPMATNWLVQLHGGSVPGNIYDALAPAVLDLRNRIEAEPGDGRILSDQLFYLPVPPGEGERIISLDVHRIPHGELALVLNDVTERMEHRQAILRRDAQLRSIFDSVRQHMIVLLDQNGRVREYNASIARLTGYDESVLGEPLACFFARAADAEFLLAEARARGEAELEARMVNLEGNGWWGDSVLSRIATSSGATQAFTLVTRESSERHAEEQQLRDQASRDPLTDLLNRRTFADVFDTVRKRCRRRGEPYALLLFDIDLFKTVNDCYGHPAGDEVLKGVAQRFAAAIRERDTLARIGGEEMAILAPGADVSAARALAERCRHNIAQGPFHVDGVGAISVTTSGGIAVFSGDGEGSFEEMYERADRALYRAKDEGRNRVVVA